MAGKPVHIELGGKTRELRYDMNALVEVEERLGVALAEIANVTASIKTLRTLLWAGLLHNGEGLTEDDIGAMVGGDNMTIVLTKCSEAISEAFDVPGHPTMPGPSPSTGAESGRQH